MMATRTLVSVDSQEQCLGMMLTLIPETPVASACVPCSSMGLEPDHPCSLAVWALKLQALSSTHYCLADPLMVSTRCLWLCSLVQHEHTTHAYS